MKVTHRLLVALFAAAAVAPLGAQEIKIDLNSGDKAAKPAATTPATPAKPAAATPATPAAPAAGPAVAKQYSQEQKLEAWGWIMARQIGIERLDFSEAEARALAQGIMLVALRRNPASYDLQEILPQTQEVIRQKTEVAAAREKKALDEFLAEQKKANDAYLAEIDKKEGVQKTASGLRYEIILKGTGAKPKADQTVKIHFTGKFLNGQVFDSTAGRDAVEYVVENVLPGWKEGLQLMNQGGKIRLHMPPDLGWGDRGNEVVAPGSFLVFDIDLIEVKDTPKEKTEAKK